MNGLRCEYSTHLGAMFQLPLCLSSSISDPFSMGTIDPCKQYQYCNHLLSSYIHRFIPFIFALWYLFACWNSSNNTTIIHSPSYIHPIYICLEVPPRLLKMRLASQMVKRSCSNMTRQLLLQLFSVATWYITKTTISLYMWVF